MSLELFKQQLALPRHSDLALKLHLITTPCLNGEEEGIEWGANLRRRGEGEGGLWVKSDYNR